MAIATENGVNRKTVRLWRERFRGGGPQALWEIAPGRGRKPSYDATRIKAVIDATLQTKPKGNTHWSCRTMAVAQGIGKSSVSRIWRSHNIKPHRTETFKLSRDPRFLAGVSHGVKGKGGYPLQDEWDSAGIPYIPRGQMMIGSA
jgi:transposase